jgi:large subunit ribosomal protein L29
VNPEEVRVLEPDELADRLKSSRRELYELRFKLAVGQLDDHRQIRKVRQDIARLLTFKRQRELGLLAAAPEAAAAAEAPTAAAEEAPAAEPEPEASEEQEEE